MLELQDDTLVEVMLNALETMAFVTLMPAEQPYARGEELRRVSIDFAGPPGRGSLQVVAPAALGRLLVANLMGISPEDEQAASGADDALRELLNVACGTLLRQWTAHSAEPVEMGIPRVEGFADDWDQLARCDGVHVLDADGHVIALRLTEQGS